MLTTHFPIQDDQQLIIKLDQILYEVRVPHLFSFMNIKQGEKHVPICGDIRKFVAIQKILAGFDERRKAEVGLMHSIDNYNKYFCDLLSNKVHALCLLLSNR